MDPLAIAASTGEYSRLEKVQNALTNPKTTHIIITFSIGGEKYTTTFNINNTCSRKYSSHSVKNKCIEIEYNPRSTKRWMSVLKKNSPSIRAFIRTPSAAASRMRSFMRTRSASKAASSTPSTPSTVPKVGSLDMLQILATKMRLCIPGINPHDIYIQDAAILSEDHSKLSDFKVVRGLLPTYVKYGYYPKEAKQWNEIMEFAKLADSWNRLQEFVPEGFDVYEAIKETSASEMDSDMSIVDVMKRIPYELDLEYSDKMVHFIHSAIFPGRGGPSKEFDLFVFTPESPEWNAIKHMMVITDVVVVTEGTHRKTTRHRPSSRKN